MAQLEPIFTEQEILENLNSGQPEQIWYSAEGVHAMISVIKNDTGLVFLPNKGVLVKAFINVKTGEVKNYAVFLMKGLDYGTDK